MKTERRHELQTNELADWLGNALQVVEENYRTILAVIVAIVAVVGAGVYLKSESSSRREQAWDRYFQAQASPDRINEMLTVAENYDGTAAAGWARLTVADTQLAIGSDQLFRERAEANDQLHKAEANYQDVADSSLAGSEPLLQQRAIFGLARTYESLNDLEKAREQYKLLTDKNKWTYPIFALEAERRLQSLQQPATKAFYDWFAQQEAKSPETAPPTSGIDLNKLPDESDFPSTKAEPNAAPESDQAPATGAAEAPAAATPPDGESPAETPPAAEVPAESSPAPANTDAPAASAEAPAAPANP